MEEQVLPNEPAGSETVQAKTSGRYKPWVRLVALILVFAMLMSITRVDFSLMRYQGTDQMVAAQYLMDSTSYLGESRLQRLKSLLTGLDSLNLNLQAADIAIAKTDYTKAASFLEKSVLLTSDSLQKAELYNRLGCVYMLLNEPVQALQAFQKSVAENPEEPTPYLLRAQLRYQDQDIEGAVQDARTYLELGGSDAQMLTTVSSICELGGDLQSAEEAMNVMLGQVEDDTEKARAYAERGRLLYLRGDDAAAAADIMEAKRLNVGVLTGVHYAIIGLHEYVKGNYADSRDYFLKAARLSEDGNSEYYEQAILCGYLSEDYEFIRQTIEEAESLNKMTASSLLIEGILLFSETDYAKADEVLSRSIDTGTIVPGVYYYRGLTRLASNQYEDAVTDFTEALNWEENIISCVFNRGVCYFAMEEDEKATEDLIYVVENDTEGSLAVSAQELLDTMAEMQETADSAA